MSELPAGIPAAEPAEPKDSASAILLREAPEGTEVLLGLRSRKSRFMPAHLAFPGGGVDPPDRPREPGAYRRCVSRELQEETGIRVAPALWLDAGERITPPMFPLRFRTRFFVGLHPAGQPEPAPASAEIETLSFARPGQVLEQWERGACKVPPPVLPILRALAGRASWSTEDASREIARVNEQEQRAPRIEFVPDVWMLPVRTATLPPATHTNVWLPGARSFAIIDPGTEEPAERARLLEVVERLREVGRRPAAILLTHHHRDHVGGALPLARELGLAVRAHAQVLESLGGGDTAVDLVPLADGDAIDLDGASLVALHTPGHAPGHLAFHLAERRLLFAGDLLSGLSTILIDPDEGDMSAYLASLARVRGLGCRVLFPGHGPPLPAAALERLIRHRLDRESRVLQRVRDPRTALADVARAVYADVPQMPPPLIERQALSHLLRLERLGRVRREDPQGRHWAPQGTARAIEAILERVLRPQHLELRDDSANHAGHAGASSGGGHYKLLIVSVLFEKRTLLERHRMVNDALRDLFGPRIHALGLKTLTPEEWARRQERGERGDKRGDRP